MATSKATPADDIVVAHTFYLHWFWGILQARKLRRCVASSKRTGGESGLGYRFRHFQFTKDYSSEGWASYYAKNSTKLAKAVKALGGVKIGGVKIGGVKIGGVKKPLEDRLDDLRFAKDEAFLVVKRVFARRPWYKLYSCKRIEREVLSGRGTPGEPLPFIADSTNDLIATTLLHVLNATHRHKVLSSEPMFRDYMTVPGVERDQFTRDYDIPLRFRTIDPEFHFSDEVNVPANEIAPRYIVFLCIENPLKEPLLLLPVKYIVDHLGQSAQDPLREAAYDVYDHWNPTLSHMENGRRKRILGGSNDNPWEAKLSFDANRINLTSTATTARHTSAVSDLRKAMKEAAPKVLEVTLRPGQALIIDNHKVLVRRAESKAAGSRLWFEWFRRDLRTTRWIRLYAGFPPPLSAGVVKQGSISFNGPELKPDAAQTPAR